MNSDYFDNHVAFAPPDQRELAIWELTGRLHRVNAYVKTSLAEALRDAPLSLSEVFTLASLTMEPTHTLSHSRLAEETFTNTSTITNRIDRLEARGLVRRQSAPNDRRTILVAITPDGREAYRESTQIIAAVYAALFQGLNQDDLDVVNLGLRRLLRMLEGDRETTNRAISAQVEAD